jgi:hypothetical protein
MNILSNKVKIIIVFANIFFLIVFTFYSMNYVAYKKIFFDEPKRYYIKRKNDFDEKRNIFSA